MIEVKGLKKRFKKKEVLHGVNLSIGSGICGLLGPNGSGKTTLLRCMTDIYPNYTGSVRYNGEELAHSASLSRKIGYLPQKFDMFHELRLEEMMRYFAEMKKIPRGEQAAQIERVLKMVNLYENRKDKVGSMSGGMIRRAGIAQAVLGDPIAVIVDEPTAGLDPEERLRFKSVVARIGTKCTVLLSTHIIEDVEALCENIIVLHQGQVRFSGTPQEISALADEHVFIADGSPVEEEGVAVIKQFEHEGRLFSRLIAVENHGGWRPAEASVEDGYMFIIKGFYHETLLD